MKKFAIRTLAALCVVAAIFGVSLWITTTTIEVPSIAQREFTIDATMARVRKIFVRTNVTRELVALGGSEFVEQNTDGMAIGFERPLRDQDWDVQGSGTLVVRTKGALTGVHELTLKQVFDVQPDRLQATNTLAEPVGPIRLYDSILVLEPDETGKAHFTTTLSLLYRQQVNWLTRGFAVSKIKAAAPDALEQQEKVLQQIVDKHANKWIILPEFDK